MVYSDAYFGEKLGDVPFEISQAIESIQLSGKNPNVAGVFKRVKDSMKKTLDYNKLTKDQQIYLKDFVYETFYDLKEIGF